ncbi:DUF6265 family protein [Sphingopyxis sp.]|uniref:DUF6265 family protein n=1 Tax=Sphingopyxis sp. TaxID=1908224 RepID=UPI001DC0D948|nr:DUF6265 family protein [Sphingopyxis sp.]MBW8297200.1 hypothetical protein [Sphingopyxis sp.]
MKAILAMAAAAVLAAASPAATVDDLAWLAGRWSREEGERWTEESWTAPRGGVMLGHSRSGRGDSLRDFEFLRVQAGADGIPAYIAQPGGGAPVAFRLVRRDATSASFENVLHDYPQRIQYARDGETLTATISLIDGSKPISWTLRRH